MENIHNYYEQEVTTQLDLMAAQLPDFSESDLLDVICIALNKFPAKYYRHGIDLKFYMSENEKRDIANRVSEAIQQAAEIVISNPRPG